MIVSKDKINSVHHISGITPDWFIELPFKEKETFEEHDVTCVFSIDEFLKPRVLKFVDIEYYTHVNNTILENARFNGKVPRYVYVFKGKPFNIEETRNRLSRL